MSRGVQVVALVVLTWLWMPTPVSTQGPTVEQGCAYDACALRLWDADLLEGQKAERVARFGFFRPPAARELFESSDSATSYLDVVEDTYTSGRVLWFVGQIVSAAGLVMSFSSDSDVQHSGFGAQAAGFVVVWLGQRRVTRAREAMSRAVWWYNRDVAAGRSLGAR